MDLEIFKLSKHANKTGLVDFLDGEEEAHIENLLKFKLNDYKSTNDVDTTLLLRAIIHGSPIETALQRRFLIAKCVVNWLCNEENDAPEKSKQASSVVNLILPELEFFSTSMLNQLATMTVDAIKENRAIHLRSLDVFSKTWNLLVAAEEHVECSNLFDDLLNADWNYQIVVGIVSALNDMELSKSQLEAVLKVLIKEMYNVEIEQIPPLVWQLLLLSRKGYKRLVLNGILDFFNQDSDHDTSSIEGTVMLHVSFALKQDQELGNELLKIIKTNKASQLELFNVACLLTAARIHRLQDTVYDLFKSSIISIYRDTDKLDRCYWISEYSSLDADKYGRVLLDVTDKSATAGWDQVIQSLTQLAILLIDTGANAGSFFQSNATIKTRSHTSKEDGPMEKVIQLGINILLRLFKYHDIVRTEILEQITSRIVSRSNSAIDFLKLLSTIIREYPESVDKYLNNIKDTLDILSFLPLPTAERLLYAIQPISKTNDHFRDGLILILRKSLFAKDLDGREMAVRGFLNTLNEQLGEADEEQAQGVAFEIMGLLRRCFSQQNEVRVCTYNGLGSLSMQHPSFAGDIFDLLYTQFLKSYEKNTSITNPIKIDACIENANNGGYPKVNEPIHVLLANLVKSFRIASTQKVTAVTQETLSRFKINMDSVIDRLLKCNLEDFELDKTANFDMATHIGLKNNQFAGLMIGIYEISIEYVYLNEGITVASTEKILTLFKKRKSIIHVLKESSTNEKGRKTGQIQTQTYASLTFTSKLFQAVFSQDNVTKEEYSIRDLRTDIDFAHFIVTSTFDSLKYAIDDEYCRRDEEYLDQIVTICKTYIALLVNEDSDSTYASHPSAKKSTSVLGSIANSVLSTFEIVNHVWPDHFRSFLISILANDDEYGNKSTNRIIIEITLQLKEVVLKYLSGRTPIYKEASQVMHIVSFLCSKLDKKSMDFTVRSKHAINWLNELAKERPIEEVSLARDVFTLLIDLCASIGEFDTIQRIAEDVHLFMGDLELPDDSQMEQTMTYQIINQKTYVTIISRLFEFLDASFDDLTWSIGRLKICAMDSLEDKARPFEKETCRRIICLLMILSELVKSVLTDTHAESLFKTLTKAYKTLHTLVKYKTSYPQEVSPDFITVISRCGTEVTDKMYKFLTVYGQSQSQDEGSKKKGKRREVDMKQKAKILRETKMIPNLIFAVEQFERHLIQLSRKSRVDFMQYMKRSTSRDFKIQVDKIMEPGESSSEDEASLKRVNEEGESSTKRARA